MPPSRGRFIFLVAVLIGVTALIVVQLVRYQLVQHEPVAAGIPRLIQPDVAPRGWIYDRNGFVLVADVPAYAVLVDKFSANLDTVAAKLLPLVKMKPEEYWQLVNYPGLVEVPLLRDLTPEDAQRIREQGIRGVVLRPYYRRAYPEGALAAHVLGFVNDQRRGFYGVEGKYNEILSGVTITDTDLPEMRPGADLVLTIDRTAQAIVEEELARAISETRAASGSIIAMAPDTGEILALAVSPTFDPAQYLQLIKEDPKRFVDQAVSDIFEPGSTFKVLTLAAALDSGAVPDNFTYFDTAYIEIGGQMIWNWDRAGHGQVDLTEFMARSLNVGAATLAMEMGQQEFYRYMRAFGLGQKTGVDLAAEEAGLVRTRDDNPGTINGQPGWSESDLGTNAFGQGISTTPLQMVSAVAALANQGVMVQPHIVKRIASSERTNEARPVQLGRPVSAETARKVTDILVEAVRREVPDAQVDGYRIAGKTGTAEIPVPGGYDDSGTIASFIGYGPATNPKVVILVKLDRPQTSQWGSETAAPVFGRVAARLFPLVDAQPDDVQLSLND